MLDKKFSEILINILHDIEKFMIVQNRINQDLEKRIDELEEEVEKLKFYISNLKWNVENSD